MATLHIVVRRPGARIVQLARRPRLLLGALTAAGAIVAWDLRGAYLDAKAAVASSGAAVQPPITGHSSIGHADLAWAATSAAVAVLALVVLLSLSGRRMYIEHHPLCTACGKRARSDARLCRHCRSQLITRRTMYLTSGTLLTPSKRTS